MDVAQTASFLQSMTYETGILDYDDFPLTTEPVWILGAKYSAINEMDELKCDFLSRLWFTYRRGYTPIGGTGPSSDAGWGCMLRCGQMMLAQALVNRHLGRGWRWVPGKYDPKAFEILRMFLDKKGSTYSIHQIASMGASEGKSVGEWFGPNTIAQVLKKLAVYDEWSKLIIHVALDNTVIVDDLRRLCVQTDSNKKSSRMEKPPPCSCSSLSSSSSAGSINTLNCTATSSSVLPSVHHPRKKPSRSDAKNRKSSVTNGYGGKTSHRRDSGKRSKDLRNSQERKCSCNARQDASFQPLLLIVPLRLGLTEINPVYVSALKKCLMFPQSVGIIGGKPNHAHWFIGHVDDQLLYLDPHTTQSYSDITEPGQNDHTYHCDYISRMKITSLDPSIALGFYCGSEDELTDLCDQIRREIIHTEKTPMFELHDHRPPHWPPFEPYSPEGATGTDFTVVDEADRLFDTDDEFELL